MRNVAERASGLRPSQAGATQEPGQDLVRGRRSGHRGHQPRQERGTPGRRRRRHCDGVVCRGPLVSPTRDGGQSLRPNRRTWPGLGTSALAAREGDVADGAGQVRHVRRWMKSMPSTKVT